MKSEFVYITYIKTTPAELWHSLTNTGIVKQWWGGGVNIRSDWKPGSSWAMSYEDGRPADIGEILEIDPPWRMVFKWRNESNTEMKDEGFSRCIMELEQLDEAVKLTVMHGIDFPNSKFIQVVSGGWPLILSNLKSLIETGEIVLKERTDSYGRSK